MTCPSCNQPASFIYRSGCASPTCPGFHVKSAAFLRSVTPTPKKPYWAQGACRSTP